MTLSLKVVNFSPKILLPRMDGSFAPTASQSSSLAYILLWNRHAAGDLAAPDSSLELEYGFPPSVPPSPLRSLAITISLLSNSHDRANDRRDRPSFVGSPFVPPCRDVPFTLLLLSASLPHAAAAVAAAASFLLLPSNRRRQGRNESNNCLRPPPPRRRPNDAYPLHDTSFVYQRDACALHGARVSGYLFHIFCSYYFHHFHH